MAVINGSRLRTDLALREFESSRIQHVGAKSALLLLSAKGHAARRLFACKRAHDGSACYQPFAGCACGAWIQSHMIRVSILINPSKKATTVVAAFSNTLMMKYCPSS